MRDVATKLPYFDQLKNSELRPQPPACKPYGLEAEPEAGARGIEGRKLFKDDKDRKSFLDRLANILDETQTQCYVYPVEFTSVTA